MLKNVYEGLEIKKLECVGHYKKRIDIRLRNLTEKEKGLGGGGSWQTDRCNKRPPTEFWRCRNLSK